MRKLAFLLLFFLIIGMQSLFAQKTITGKVTDAKDGSSLPGVDVSVQGTPLAVVTSSDGTFSFKVTDKAKTLVFSFVGYETQEIPINGKSEINIQLKASLTALDEVVVIGYGTGQKLGTVVGSVVTVKPDLLQNKPAADFIDALQGKVAGLQVYTSSGEPSEIPSIRLFGSGSLSGVTTPLFVLDGVPVDESLLLTLNSNDFATITVLKDATATSIYGARAANGVIFITTKQGTANTNATISLSAQYGLSSLANTDYFKHFMNTKQLTDFWVAIGYQTQAQITNLLQNYPNDTKWYKYYYKDNAPTYQGDISFSGGAGKTTYFISGSYYNQEGLAVESFYNRYTLRSNITTKANNWLSMGLNLSGSYDMRNTNPYTTNSTNGGLSMLAQPFYSPYDPTGKKYPNLIPGWNRYNPQYLQDEHPYDGNNTQFNGLIYFQITPFKGLTAKSQLGLVGTDLRVTSLRLPGDLQSLNNGAASESFARNINKTITNTIEYKFDIAKRNTFTILGGQEGIANTMTSFDGSSSGQTDDRLTLLNNGPNSLAVNSGENQFAYLSYFGRVDYGLDEKYYIDLSVRNDLSSRFGKDKRSAFFYASGIRWDAKKETFLRDVRPISSLSLKLSYGTSGNSDLSNYTENGDYLSLALISSGQYGANTAWTISSPGNPNLGWESQALTTLGVNISMFANKYRLNVDLYNRVTSSMLVDVPYPYTSGFNTVLTNVGTLRNQGVAVTFDFDIVKTNDFFITPYINYTYNSEKVTSLFQGKSFWIIPNTGVCWAVGKPISFFYPIFAGIDPADGAPMWYVPGEDITKTTKTTTTKDFNPTTLEQNTGIKLNPPTVGGFGLNAGWKHITLQADFSFALGKYLINNDRYFFENPNVFTGFNQLTTVLDYWKKPGDKTRFPDIQNYQFTQFDSQLIENASFMRLKNLTLAYSLPNTLVSKTKFFKSAKVFLNGRNLFTVTKYTGPDPEVDANLTLGVNPNTKQYSAGIDLTF